MCPKHLKRYQRKRRIIHDINLKHLSYHNVEDLKEGLKMFNLDNSFTLSCSGNAQLSMN